MAKPITVHFIYRKPNPGNYSIETIYDQLLSYWKQNNSKAINPHKIKLNYNYDLGTFFTCCFKSLFGKVTVAHITGGCNYMVLAFPFAKRVLTIHDLFRLKEDKMRFSGLYRWLYYTLPIRFSHKIVAVSEQTKQELILHFPAAEAKVVVIGNPLNPVFLEHSKDAQQAAWSKQSLKILQLGSKPLKNYENLISATSGLNVTYTFVHGNTQAIKRLIEQEDIANKSQVLNSLDTHELVNTYLEADVLFFASFAEGFGLPLLEAQAVHLPIITSDREPMRSLAPGALLVDPTDRDEIKEAFIDLMTKGYKAEILTEAKLAMRSFSLPKIAAAYEACYLQLF